LSNKKYHEIIDEDSGLNLSPDFIVLFLPGENMLQIALKEDTKMWEKAAKNKVILASPYILLALLKSIFMSWRDRERDENVKTILSVSDEVVDRVEILMKHLNKTQESIKNTVTSWNNAISSYENRLQKTRVRLQELKEDNETLTELDKVEDSPNKLE
jgi:DNA recombination protein RmuC